jgi:hypothetical protein
MWCAPSFAPALHRRSYETLLLENAMSKLGGLLQVGFGEAGGAIIAKNMRMHGRLDCLIPGFKVRLLISRCASGRVVSHQYPSVPMALAVH